MEGEVVVGTRLHWHSHSRHKRIDVVKVLNQVLAFCDRAATYADGGILIALGLPVAMAGSLTAAHVSDEKASTTDDFIASVRELCTHLQRETSVQPFFGRVRIIPMLYWGKFVPALNALIGTAAEQFPKATSLLLQSLEMDVDTTSIELLHSHFDHSRDLVVGAAMPGHDFQPDPESQPIELSGLTSPWNTLALWNLEKLAKVGFVLTGDALRLEVEGIG